MGYKDYHIGGTYEDEGGDPTSGRYDLTPQSLEEKRKKEAEDIRIAQEKRLRPLVEVAYKSKQDPRNVPSSYERNEKVADRRLTSSRPGIKSSSSTPSRKDVSQRIPQKKPLTQPKAEIPRRNPVEQQPNVKPQYSKPLPLQRQGVSTSTASSNKKFSVHPKSITPKHALIKCRRCHQFIRVDRLQHHYKKVHANKH